MLIENDKYNWRSLAENQPIWRYMDFVKYVALLESQSLYFPRVGTLNDCCEGSLLPFLPTHVQDILSSPGTKQQAEKQLQAQNTSMKAIAPWAFKCKEECFVNCWHINDGESAALWKLYLKSGEGIAIKTTIANYVDVLGQSDFNMCIAPVHYDHSPSRLTNTNSESGSGRIIDPLDIVFSKRACFIHERELRAVISADLNRGKQLKNLEGLCLSIELRKLVTEVLIGPGLPDWICILIERITSKYIPDAIIKRSSLYNPPYF